MDANSERKNVQILQQSSDMRERVSTDELNVHLPFSIEMDRAGQNIFQVIRNMETVSYTHLTLPTIYSV